MAENAPAESHTTGSQIHPLLRQRMLNRAATFSEGAQPNPSLQRRRSSWVSEFSDTRQSFRSSTDNLLRPGGRQMDHSQSSEENSPWHSAPLVFAILPAIGGLFFQNGSALITDILLLGLGSLFLNWCVRAPWDWYYAAQVVEYIEPEYERFDDTTIVEVEESEEELDGGDKSSPEPKPAAEPAKLEKSTPKGRTPAQEAAYSELSRERIYAMIACFVGPVLGSYLLHTIRSQLTPRSEGLVSDYNLSIFLMAAELRPVAHIIKLKQGRMSNVQRIVRTDLESGDRLTASDAREMSQRLSDIETKLSAPLGKDDINTLEVSATVRQGLQPQLDALNRAVRRYEKRQAAQTIQVEARFAELDARLKDALSLAAAAARTGQKPGLISMVLTWFIRVVTYWMHLFWDIFTYPFRFVAVISAEIKSWFVRTERQPRRRTQGKSNGHPSLSTPRMQSRTGR